MAIQTFDFDDYLLTDPSGTVAFRVLKAQFGDGYAQTAEDGLNSAIETWPLVFAGRLNELAPIKAFLKAHGGWKAFYWTPPMGELGLYKAASLSITASTGNNYNLSVTLEEAFKP